MAGNQSYIVGSVAQGGAVNPYVSGEEKQRRSSGAQVPGTTNLPQAESAAAEPFAAPGQTDYSAELEHIWQMLEENNQQFERMLKESARIKEPEQSTTPSVFGLSVMAAGQRLKRAGLSVKRISQEYSSRVPAGHVISQIPGPGCGIQLGGGVRLIISKGPPPDKEKYDLVRKKEDVPVEYRPESNKNTLYDEDGGVLSGPADQPAGTLIVSG